ncbi:MAG: hypothetical protein IPI61_02645 [Syntrophaceae bacterium]|nr:hypothetical protein [Syntrophaceae bacterium]
MILAHLLEYDSVHGKFPAGSPAPDKALVVNGRKSGSPMSPTTAPCSWKEMGVEIVLESMGEFERRRRWPRTSRRAPERVIIAAPASTSTAPS